MKFSNISATQAQALMAQRDVNLADIRDQQSYQQAHIRDAKHLDNQSVTRFVANTDKDKPLIICCYHGNTSQSVAQFFAEQAFAEVYSLDGGFEQWRTLFPDQCESGQEVNHR